MHFHWGLRASSPRLTRLIRTLLVAERQLIGSRPRAVSALPTPDALSTWCHRCGATVHDSRGRVQFNAIAYGCVRCAGRRIERDRTVRLGRYDGAWRDAVLEVKHSGDRALAQRLGRLLAEQWMREVESAPKSSRLTLARALLVPIPMPLARRIERGIDHTAEITRGISSATGIPIHNCLTHDSGPVQAEMTELSRHGRLQRIHPNAKPNAKLIAKQPDFASHPLLIVVDDVLTTGSTLLQASNALKSLFPSASIAALVVAVADKRRNA